MSMSGLIGAPYNRLALTYDNMCVLLSTMKLFDEAIKYCQLALNIRMDILGPQHLDVANSRYNLGTCRDLLSKIFARSC